MHLIEFVSCLGFYFLKAATNSSQEEPLQVERLKLSDVKHHFLKDFVVRP